MSEPDTGGRDPGEARDPGEQPDPPASVRPVVPPPPAPHHAAAAHPPRAPAPQRIDFSPALAEFGHAVRSLTPRLFVTQGIIAANVLVYALMVIRRVSPMEPKNTDLVAWGASFGPLTTGGQWWRLFTAMFLHIGAIHLAMNMYVLWNVGPLVERMLGNVGFLLLYVAAGLAGSVASVVWNPNVISAGASGAVFGVYGCLLGFLVMERKSVPREVLAQLQRSAVVFVGYNMIFGLTVKGIDMAAHLGGLGGGFVGGLVVAHPLDLKGASRRWLRNAALAVLAVVALGSATQIAARHAREQGTVETFPAMETRTMAELKRIFDERQAGTMTNAQGADLIEKDILPAWKATHEQLAAVEDLPEDKRALMKVVLEYVGVREEAFDLMAQGMRANDDALIRRGLDRYEVATALAQAQNARDPKK